MKKIVIQWAAQKPNDSGKQSRRLVGAAHPGCCKKRWRLREEARLVAITACNE